MPKGSNPAAANAVRPARSAAAIRARNPGSATASGNAPTARPVRSSTAASIRDRAAGASTSKPARRAGRRSR